MVNIHKRERTSPLFKVGASQESNTVLKKRKFKLVPNELDDVVNIKQEHSVDINQSLPEDRKDILKLVSYKLQPFLYNEFL